MRDAELRAVDFAEALHDVRGDDFVYLDPPYISSTRPSYGEYGYGSFSSPDLGRLIDAVRRLDRKGALFVLSYRENEDLRQQLADFQTVTLTVRRQVAGFAASRAVDNEMLITNVKQRGHQ